MPISDFTQDRSFVGAPPPSPTNSIAQTLAEAFDNGARNGIQEFLASDANSQVDPSSRGSVAPDFSPGRQDALEAFGIVAPGAFGLGATALNGALGIAAGREQLGAIGVNPSWGDLFGAATGLDMASDYTQGVGGYGDLGVGGRTGMQNFFDPGVMGAARGYSNTQFNSLLDAIQGNNGYSGGDYVGDYESQAANDAAAAAAAEANAAAGRGFDPSVDSDTGFGGANNNDNYSYSGGSDNDMGGYY